MFDDLALPNMVRKELKDATEFAYLRVVLPMRFRIVSILSAPVVPMLAVLLFLAGIGKDSASKRELREMEIAPEETDIEGGGDPRRIKDCDKIKRLPFIDDFDLKFNNMVKVPMPPTRR